MVIPEHCCRIHPYAGLALCALALIGLSIICNNYEWIALWLMTYLYGIVGGWANKRLPLVYKQLAETVLLIVYVWAFIVASVLIYSPNINLPWL
jgi:hypothetical protein